MRRVRIPVIAVRSLQGEARRAGAGVAVNAYHFAPVVSMSCVGVAAWVSLRMLLGPMRAGVLCRGRNRALLA